VILFNTFVIYALFLNIIRATSLHDPYFQYWPLIVAILLEVINIVGAIGILNWKKWGFYMFIIGGGCALIFNLSLGRAFGQAALYSLFPTAIIAGMIFQKNRWKMFE